MNYEDGYDDGFEAGKKSQKQAASTWNGWDNLSEAAFAVHQQLAQQNDPNQSCTTLVTRSASASPLVVRFPSGQTLTTLSANVGAALDLNSYDWNDVTAATNGRKTTSGADKIQFRDKDNRLISYYFLSDGSKWGLAPSYAKLASYQYLIEDGAAILPADTIFWYVRYASGEATVTIG